MPISKYPDYTSATGEVRYNMTNNYMFHYVLQKNQIALKGLIASLLHLKLSSIRSVTIENPVLLGDTLSSKDSILDLLVCFNNNTFVNLEMQVRDEHNWTDRSLYYLSREFSTLRHGDDFRDVRPVIHISFLDFTLFEELPEFYATYRMKNVRNGKLYSDKLTVSVVQLNHVELATEEDQKYGIDQWARFFKARTWEEIKMNAIMTPTLESAARTLYGANLDDSILALCIKSQEEIDGERHRRERLAKLDKVIAKKDRQIAKKDQQLSEKNQQLTEKDQQLTEKDQQLTEKDQQLSEKDRQIADLISKLKAQGVEI